MMTGDTALEALGVTADLLSDEERRHLDELGYVVLDGVLSAEQLEEIRDRLPRVIDERRESTADEARLRIQAGRRLGYFEKWLAHGFLRTPERRAALQENAGAIRAALAANDLPTLRKIVEETFGGYPTGQFTLDLLGTDPAFDLPLTTPRVLAAASHIVGSDMHAWGIFAREPRIGDGYQGLHRDFGKRTDMCNTLWLIDDTTVENGATRIVPGSHLSDLDPDPDAPHPDEIVLEGKAGQVVVISERTLHGGTVRRGGPPRRVLLAPFSVRWKFRDHPLHVSPEAVARFSPPQRWLLNLQDPMLSVNERVHAETGAPAPGYA